MSKKEETIMFKNMNKFWNKEKEAIETGVFAVAMVLAVIMLRYAIYFL